MRTNILLTSILTIGFLAASAGMALAQGGGGPDAEERQARRAALMEARNGSIQQFREDRAAAIEEYRAAHNATKASFLENRTRVVDECRAARNASADDNNSEYASCVRDGLRPLIDHARAEHREQRQSLVDKLIAAREAAKASFLAARQAYMASRGSG